LSPCFPNIPLAQIIPATVERAWQAGSVQALEEFERAIALYKLANFNESVEHNKQKL
jgi:hypothetical protein